MPDDTSITCLTTDLLRVAAREAEGRVFLELSCRKGDGWRVIAVTGMIAPPAFYTTETALICEDPLLEWRQGEGEELQRATACFTGAVLSEDGALQLTGQAGCHRLTLAVTCPEADRLHFVLTDHLAGDTGIALAQLMSHLYFTPDGKAARACEPLDFAWLPALHGSGEHVCADHFFRSPGDRAGGGACARCCRTWISPHYATTARTRWICASPVPRSKPRACPMACVARAQRPRLLLHDRGDMCRW